VALIRVAKPRIFAEPGETPVSAESLDVGPMDASLLAVGQLLRVRAMAVEVAAADPASAARALTTSATATA
jgi:hypothetical protein